MPPANALAENIRAASETGKVATWSVPTATTEPLAINVRRVLTEPLETFLEARSIAFCLPDKVIYVQTEEHFNELAGKATMVLQGLERTESEIGRTCLELALSTKSRVTCSVYVSNRDEAAFDVHADDWDVHVIQIAGTKEFEIFEDRRRTIQSTPGTCLYIPRGVLHRASTIDRSMHLSIGVHHQVYPEV